MTERSVRRRGVLTREDLKLWAHVTRGVDPMQGRAAARYEEALAEVVESAAPAAQPVQDGKKAGGTATATASTKAAARKPTAPPPIPLAPMERKLRQRLARGQRPVDGMIDLHGLRQAEAHMALIGFIHRAQAQGRSVVLVITGKGGAAGEADARGVLRRAVPHWLGDPALRRHIVGFEPAARGHGGEGALYVRIRKLKA